MHLCFHHFYNWDVEKAKEDRKEPGVQTASNAASIHQGLSNSSVMMNRSSIEVSFLFTDEGKCSICDDHELWSDIP